jgi:hypothetical protein
MCSGMTVGLATAAVPIAGFAGALVALVIAGAATTVTNVLVITLVQQATPAWLLGRMMGVIMFASLGLFPVSVAGASLVVDRLGAPTVFTGTGLLLVLAFGAGLRRLWPVTARLGTRTALPTHDLDAVETRPGALGTIRS